MKIFLYMIQSRIKFLENHKVLQTDDSDVLILTFEEKIDKENFIYAPNTTWEEGRNKLIEEARKSISILYSSG